ncbi:uncharacterized protein BDV17DRAFT_14505 [Aspergillus undulatus]|uniref:uncharacterized protein n=1 Tax=Aspergillus undulatus TaxID=1810928 RepID=UPI003CCDEAD9
MRLIKGETTVPLPEVYDFDDSYDNVLDCPFILMEYVDGRSLYEAWFDRDVSHEVLEEHRIQVLRDVAEAIVQLDMFTFSQRGMPLFHSNGNLSGDVGSFRQLDINAMLELLRKDSVYDGSAFFFEVAPLSDLKSCFTHALDKRGYATG